MVSCPYPYGAYSLLGKTKSNNNKNPTKCPRVIGKVNSSLLEQAVKDVCPDFRSFKEVFLDKEMF